MIKRVCPLVLVFAMLLSLSGCRAVYLDENADAYEFTDALCNEVRVIGTPKTVAVLFSSFAEIWTLAGGEVTVTVGESVERGFADATAVLVDGGAGKTIDNERLLSSEPDFVIGSADISAHIDAAKILNAAGVPCALFRVETFEDYLKTLKIFTDIMRNDAAFERYGTQVKTQVDTLINDAVYKDKRILFIRSGSGASSAKAKTADEHFAAFMLENLGAYNIADNAPVLLDGLSIEEILKEDPDCIFITTMGDETAAKEYMNSVLSSSAWQTLTAVKEGRCYYLPKDMFQFKPNAKWADAYKYLVDLLDE